MGTMKKHKKVSCTGEYDLRVHYRGMVARALIALYLNPLDERRIHLRMHIICTVGKYEDSYKYVY